MSQGFTQKKLVFFSQNQIEEISIDLSVRSFFYKQI